LERVITLPWRDTARSHAYEAIVALAGPCAECRFCHYTMSERMDLWRGAWAIDLAHARRRIAAIDGGRVVAAMRPALRLVREHWGAIERVANGLLEHGELSGAQVDTLRHPRYLRRHGRVTHKLGAGATCLR
jgi:hypothetical protein